MSIQFFGQFSLGGAVALCCLLLISCGSGRVPLSGGSNKGPLLRSQHEILRTRFNSGQCAAIYDSAFDYFKRKQTMEQWLAVCAHLRSELGNWQSIDFQTNLSDVPSADGDIVVEGVAKFEQETCKFRTYWIADSTKAQLFNIVLERSKETVNVPGYSGVRFVLYN